jgi:chitodextrinase
MKKNLFLFLVFLSPLSLLAQKTMLSFNVVVYVEQKTADYFGGKLAMQDSVKAQLAKVSANFNAQSNLNNNYNFTAVSFKYYNDNTNDDSTFAYHQKAPESNNQYRLVYNAFPQKLDANSNYINAYTIVFEIGYQSVLFSYRESVSNNGSMFGRVMTNTITHEFTHSRGAWDIYAGNIDASQNLVNKNLGWKNPTPSLMNSLFTDTNLDEHTAYLVNKTASLYGTSTFTDAQRGVLTGAAFPNTISVNVLNSSGSAQSNAVDNFYGITWYPGSSYTLSTTPTYSYTTDGNGNVNFVGTANNPFNVSNGMPQYNTFFVSVTYGGQTKYAWIPCFEVSQAFIQGKTTYTKTISLASANIPPFINIGNSGNLINYNTNDFSIPIFAYDLDGSIANVKIYDNGAYFADATFDGSNIYWFLHYASLSVGKHLFTAVATDNNGATTTSGTLEVDDLPLHMLNIAITAPANGATFTTPASIPFTGYATEGGGSISKVEYYNGTTLIGTAMTRPFAFNWNNVAAGTYSLTAKAYDAQGTPATKTSTVVNITVKNAALSPTVSITSPSNNTTFTAPASITIKAAASESGGTISKVEFYKGTTLLGTSTASPYSYTWSGVAAGTYSLTAKAYDSQGTPTTKTSTVVSIIVNASLSPTVSITSPANNATFTAPASVTINASASETGGSISKVEFYIGATLLGTSTTSPYTYSWTGVAAGSYALTAKAYDNLNAGTTSSIINITVTGGSTCTAPAWNTTTAYSGGSIVSYLSIRYQANWWTQGNQPNTNSGPAGSGQPWINLGTCNSRMTDNSLNDFVLNEEIHIYPNPTGDATHIVISYVYAITEVEIISLFGQQVLSTKYNSEKSVSIFIADLNSGIYLVKALTANGSKVFKFFKD